MTIDEFLKVELKVGTIKSGERVEGSKKLLRFQVDLGAKGGGEGGSGESDVRQILSGVGEHYAPEDLVGRQVVAITNLDPRMMMGFESQGMLLAADGGVGPVLLIPDKEVPPGSNIR